jgi:trimethylamine--corrinoid protein Co-methyltransferase
MISGDYWRLLDDASVQKIDAVAVRLLTRGGARIQHDGLLDLLESAGCRIDRSARRCYFTEDLIRGTVQRIGGRASQQVRIAHGWDPRWRLNHCGSHPHYLDWPSCQRRLATRQDVIDMARMAHVLDEFAVVGKVLTCSEVDQRIEPLWAALTLAQITDKTIGGGEVFYANYLEPLVRMGEVISGKPSDNSLIASCDFFIAPLILDPNQAACFVEKRRLGCANVPGTMPVSGMSAPVTIAGTVALCVAELLAGWVLGYVVNPELRASGIVASASLDMRSMTACFSSPEAVLQNVATVNLVRRLYGIDVWAAGNYVDCKRPGLEAAYQKMYTTLGAAFGAGLLPGTEGLLSAGQDYCPAQHILDNDIAKAMERFYGHFEVSDDTLAVELIEQVMGQDHTDFLDTDHTMNHWRAEQWYPRWLDRSVWQGPAIETAAEAAMLERIAAYCRGAIARYEPPAIDGAKIRELDRIYRSAERTILGSEGAAE